MLKKVISCMLITGILSVLPLTSMHQTTFASESSTTYTVNWGDSLWKIANRYDTSVEALRNANNIWGNQINAGQTITIPSSKHSSSESWTYTVSWGDSLWKIANRYDTSVEALRNANNIWGNQINAGQTITIPSSSDYSDGQNYSGHQRLNVSSYERDLLARVVYSEARGESYTGQVAVASVVINRVLDPEYPSTIESVIFEPWAFTAVHDGQFWFTPDSTAYSAVEDALNGWDPSYGATVYYNPITATSGWVFTRPTITQIGSHLFAS